MTTVDWFLPLIAAASVAAILIGSVLGILAARRFLPIPFVAESLIEAALYLLVSERIAEFNAIRFAGRMSRIDLRGQDLSKRRLVGANLKFANLDNAILESSNLETADLRHASLRGSNLKGSSLRRTWLDMTVFDDAKLDKCDLENTFIPDNVSFQRTLLEDPLKRPKSVEIPGGHDLVTSIDADEQYLTMIRPQELEALVKFKLEAEGCDIGSLSHTEASPFDLFATKRNDPLRARVFVQVKCNPKGNKVKAPEIAALLPLAEQQMGPTDHFIMITNTTFSNEAEQLAATSKHVSLVGRDELVKWVQWFRHRKI